MTRTAAAARPVTSAIASGRADYLYSRASVESGADTAVRRGKVLRDGRFSARRVARAPATSARPWQVALLVFVTAFCLYGLTTSQQFQGYEPETNAAAEGFVLTGDFSIDPESPLRDPGAGSGGQLGENGKLIPRAGLPSVLEKVPFYAAGKLVDDRSEDGESYTWRKGALSFADPFAAAAAAAFFFLVVWRLRRSMAWALIMAGIFTAASLAWPYSKAGMETVLMMGAILMLAAVLYAQDSSSWRPWAAAGFGAGLVLADKPYGILAVGAILALLVEPWRRASRKQRRGFLLAGAVPLLAWGVAFGAFNLTRTGGILDTGRSDPELTLAAPLNAIGFMVSPGKSLFSTRRWSSWVSSACGPCGARIRGSRGPSSARSWAAWSSSPSSGSGATRPGARDTSCGWPGSCCCRCRTG